MRTFCSNLQNQLSPNVYECDIILRRGKHDVKISEYVVAVDSDLDTGVPTQAVIVDNNNGTYSARFKSDTENLPILKAQKNMEIKQSYENALNSGCVTSIGIKMDSLLEDHQSMIIGLNSFKREISNGSVSSDSTKFIKDYDNNLHPVTVDQWEQIIADMEDFGIAVWTKKSALQLQVEGASSKAELDIINW